MCFVFATIVCLCFVFATFLVCVLCLLPLFVCLYLVLVLLYNTYCHYRLAGRRELAAILKLSFLCLVTVSVLCSFLRVP